MRQTTGRPNLQLALVTSGAMDDVGQAKFNYGSGKARSKYDYRNTLLDLGLDPDQKRPTPMSMNQAPTGAWQELTEATEDSGANRGFGTGGAMFRHGVADDRQRIKLQAQKARSAMNLGNQDLFGRYQLARQLGDKKAAVFAATDPSMQRNVPIYGSPKT